MPPVSPPPDSEPDVLPTFAVPYPHEIHRAAVSMRCGCERRTIGTGLVYYDWAALEDVPEAIRAEVAATQDR